jgi:hypothetical protein
VPAVPKTLTCSVNARAVLVAAAGLVKALARKRIPTPKAAIGKILDHTTIYLEFNKYLLSILYS